MKYTGVHENDVTAHGYTKARQKLEVACELQRRLGVPAYWRGSGPKARPERHDVTREKPASWDFAFSTNWTNLSLLQQIMRGSVFPDHGGGKAPGVGTCLLRPGDPDLTRLSVTRIERVENMKLWREYQHCKAAQPERLQQPSAQLDPSNQLCQALRPITADVRMLGCPDQYCDFTGIDHRVIDRATNELWLWHGTTAENVGKIAEHGFDAGLHAISRGPGGSPRTPSHPIEDPSHSLQIGQVP
jgi:hypothetical protein